MSKGKAYLVNGDIVEISTEDTSLWNYGKRNINGVLLHNDNGPAVVWDSGSKWFCKKGIIHREDGPAEYYFDDNHNITYHFALYHYRWTPFQFAEKTNHLICKLCKNFCKQSCF